MPLLPPPECSELLIPPQIPTGHIPKGWGSPVSGGSEGKEWLPFTEGGLSQLTKQNKTEIKLREGAKPNSWTLHF